MLKKFFSTLLCPIMLLPLFSSPVAASAAQSAKAAEIVGKWIWGNTVADLGANGAEILMSRCASEGITDVYLLVKGTGGKLGYLKTQYTNILTRSDRDVLQETIDAAHKRGIRVHAWICVVQDQTYKDDHPDAGMCHYTRGRYSNFITPYDEGYREYIGNVAKELAAYDIDGLHFDYVRYNHNANGWSERDFERLAAMGANIERVKELIETTWGYNGSTANGSYIFNAYNNNDPDALLIAQYRKNNIKELAEHIVNSAKSVRSDLIISAAIMPEGAYDSATSELHYGQNYDVAADLYDYICPMAYSTTYGKPDDWVITIAKNSIDKGNKVVMGIQAFDNASTTRIMAEVENIRELMNDPNYGEGMLGTAFFRSGTFEYAKATCDTVNKIITVKLENIGSSAYTKVRVDGKNGIKLTDAAIGEGIDPNTTAKASSNGTYFTFSGKDILGAGESGYLYLKYEGETDPSKLPALVRIYRLSTEASVYTVACDVSDNNAEPGEPKFPEPEVTTEEITEAETTDPSSCLGNTEPIPEATTAEETNATPSTTEPAKSGCGGFAASGIAIAATAAGAVALKKRKKK